MDTNINKENSEKIKNLISSMTLEEKASLCSGEDFWNLKGIEHLGIPSIMVADGPHGLRKEDLSGDSPVMNPSIPSTCFPTASALASSWDRDLIKEIGIALGEECLQENVSVLLGPGVNIKRSPLCGRNFEYFSEDPYLSGELAAAYIEGVQSKGIGTSLKHFAVNNQETRRMVINAVTDERALREIYLSGFEIAVKKSQPWTVMCAYNQVNGEYCSQNEILIKKILREEWGFNGVMITDWGATVDRIKGLSAGLDLEMPSSYGLHDNIIIQAVKNGTLDEKILEKTVYRLLKMIFKAEEALKKNSTFRYSKDVHHLLAGRAAAESAVLLKNSNSLLPLELTKEHIKIAVIGKLAVAPRYQGSGSSLINPTRLDNALEQLRIAAGDNTEIVFNGAYDITVNKIDNNLIREAVLSASNADIVFLFAGLTEEYESEAFDRTTLSLPPGQNELISAVAAVNSRTVVILSNGAPVEMPWISTVPAILETYLGGQAWGSAVVDLLLGKVNPSGKLAETFPVHLEDDPSNNNFPGGDHTVEYRESIYVGYRYYSSAGKNVLFPFGHGLSYTSFKYGRLKANIITENRQFKVCLKVSVKNIGKREGKETVQFYVHKKNSSVIRPDHELKAFVKIDLKSGEKKRVKVELDRRAFAFWDIGVSDWRVEDGEYHILAGSSSSDIRSTCHIVLHSGEILSEHSNQMKLNSPEYFNPVKTDWESDNIFEKLYGKVLPVSKKPDDSPFTSESTMSDVEGTFFGRQLNKIIRKIMRKNTGKHSSPSMERMAEAMIRGLPIRLLAIFSQGKVTHKVVDAMVLMINGKYIKGLVHMIKIKLGRYKKKSK